MGERKEISTPLTFICTPDLWNKHDGVGGGFLIASKSLHNQIIKLQTGINWQFQIHMEDRLLASEMLGYFGVFRYQLEVDIEAFIFTWTSSLMEIHNYMQGSECWNVVLTMARVIWVELTKVWVESETAYG